MAIAKDFGRTLKKLRERAGLSQEALANMARLHRTYISDIERGAKNLSINNVEKLAKALKVRPKDLFG